VSSPTDGEIFWDACRTFLKTGWAALSRQRVATLLTGGFRNLGDS
jgi:hypothetical protein